MLGLSILFGVSKRLGAIFRDERGVTAMEYGLIGAATVTVIGVAVAAISPNLSTIWTAMSTTLSTAAG